jgi:hypothetical protein
MAFPIPLHVLNSLLSFVKADMSGLSCRLLPFLLLEPHLQPRLSSSCGTGVGLRLPSSKAGAWLGTPPSMADMEECAHRACLRMAEVTVMHSVMTSATGSTAIVIGVCRVRVGGMLCGSAVAAASVLSVIVLVVYSTSRRCRLPPSICGRSCLRTARLILPARHQHGQKGEVEDTTWRHVSSRSKRYSMYKLWFVARGRMNGHISYSIRRRSTERDNFLYIFDS